MAREGVPDAVETEIKAARAAGITVNTRPATMSSQDFVVHAKRLNKNARLRSEGVVVEALEGNDEISSFELTYSSDDRADSTAEASARRAVEEESGLKVRKAKRKAVALAAMTTDPAGIQSASAFAVPSRQSDTDPFYGGAAIRAPHGGVYSFCSLGFGVTRTTGSNNPRMLTAAHCEPPNVHYGWLTGDLSRSFSLASSASFTIGAPYDSLLLDPRKATGNWIYFGGWDTQSVAPIIGGTSNHAGERVYTSGAMSGKHLLEITNATSVSWNCGDPYGINCTKGATAVAIDPQTGAYDPNLTGGAEGDSGGPVVSDAGLGKMKANGTISAVTDFTYCPLRPDGVRDIARITGDPDVRCGNRVYYTSYNNLVLAYDVSEKPITFNFTTP